MKNPTLCCLTCALLLATPARAYTGVSESNPFVEAMLRMMEVFGLVDRGSLLSGVPYLPGAGTMPGLGSYYPGMGMMPGMSPLGGMGGLGGLSGLSGLGGLGGIPGGAFSNLQSFQGVVPGAGGWPSTPWNPYGLPNVPFAGGTGTQAIQDLDGTWELNNGSVAIIKGRAARLFVSREKYQDFVIGYDGRTFSWRPRGGNTTTSYRYQMRDGRMVLQDNSGKYLLMRRRN